MTPPADPIVLDPPVSVDPVMPPVQNPTQPKPKLVWDAPPLHGLPIPRADLPGLKLFVGHRSLFVDRRLVSFWSSIKGGEGSVRQFYLLNDTGADLNDVSITVSGEYRILAATRVIPRGQRGAFQVEALTNKVGLQSGELQVSAAGASRKVLLKGMVVEKADEICSAQDFRLMRQRPWGYFQLGCDVALGDTAILDVLTPFRGVLNGAGHRLRLEGAHAPLVALNHGRIFDLRFEGDGALTGVNSRHGTIHHLKLNVRSENFTQPAAVAAIRNRGYIGQVSGSVHLRSKSAVAGITHLNRGVINEVVLTKSALDSVSSAGGLANAMLSKRSPEIFIQPSIRGSSFEGKISANNSAGGLLVQAYAWTSSGASHALGPVVSNSSFIGEVSSRSQAGGLAAIYSGEIEGSFVDARITAPNGGGLVAVVKRSADPQRAQFVSIRRSFASGLLEVTGTAGGLLGRNLKQESCEVSVTDSYSRMDMAEARLAGAVAGAVEPCQTQTFRVENFLHSGALRAGSLVASYLGRTPPSVKNALINRDELFTGRGPAALDTSIPAPLATSAELRDPRTYQDWTGFSSHWSLGNLNDGLPKLQGIGFGNDACAGGACLPPPTAGGPVCTEAGVVVPEGASREFFRLPASDKDKKCLVQERKCKNGKLTGAFTLPSCPL
jgi:hypothetical protein